MLNANEKRNRGSPFLRGRPKQRNARAADIPTKPAGGDEVDQQMGSVRGQVNQAAAPERSAKRKDRRKNERNAEGDQNAVSEAMMECVQVTSKIQAQEEIEVGEICDEHQHDQLKREPAATRDDAQAPSITEVEESPKTSETVCYRRSHRRGLRGVVNFRRKRNVYCAEITNDIYGICHRLASYFVSSSCA